MAEQKNIKLSPKHGLNPAMTQCFWCDNETGIAVMGKIDKQDSKAPRNIIFDYSFCDKCQAEINKANGVLVIEASVTPVTPNQSPMPHESAKIYPTGTYVVVAPEALLRASTYVDDSDTEHHVISPEHIYAGATVIMEDAGFRKMFSHVFEERGNE